MTNEHHRSRVVAVSNIGGMGLALWICGAQEWAFFGWFFDPAVAKVGKAIFVLHIPLFVWHFVRAVYAGAIPEKEQPVCR